MTPVPVHRAGVRQIVRAMGIGEQNTDLPAAPAVRRGLGRIGEAE